jgi:hypothetical protein
MRSKLPKIPTRKLIPMREMAPLQVGFIRGGDYDDILVMRTASKFNFEVMEITQPRTGGCWDRNSSIHMVELVPAGTEITLITE